MTICQKRGGNTLENPDRYEQWLTNKFPIEPIWNPPLIQASPNEVEEQTLAILRETYEQRETEFGQETMRLLERLLLLDRIDDHWKEHLYNIDYIEGRNPFRRRIRRQRPDCRLQERGTRGL